jgi:hypothetical protein
MTNTYTFNNLHLNAQDTDLMAGVEESINDHLPVRAEFDYTYCADTKTLQITVDCDLTVAELADLADCYAELLAYA